VFVSSCLIKYEPPPPPSFVVFLYSCLSLLMSCYSSLYCIPNQNSPHLRYLLYQQFSPPQYCTFDNTKCLRKWRENWFIDVDTSVCFPTVTKWIFKRKMFQLWKNFIAWLFWPVKLSNQNGSIFWEKMSACVHVFLDFELFSRWNCCRPCDKLNGLSGGLLSHVVRYCSSHYSFYISENVSQIVGQKHVRMGEGWGFG
jgi:hypothetical protein